MWRRIGLGVGWADVAVREQAIAHNLHVIEIGQKLGSDALTVWLADGSNYPGQTHFRRSYDRVLASLQTIYAFLPESWRLFTEHKPFEPAFYSTVVTGLGFIPELVDAGLEFGDEFRPAYMIDQSHNFKDPIEALLQSVVTLQYETDVRPLIAETRLRAGGALDPVRAFRDSGYRDIVATVRTSGVYVSPKSL